MGALLALLLAAFVSLGAIAWLRRPRLGRFVITTDDERSFSFVTDTGRFRIEFEKGELTVRGPAATRSIPLDQIERLDFAHAEDLALPGSSPAGPVHWLTLWLVLAGGERIQVYAVGQLEPQQPLLRRLFALETELMARFGLFRDVERAARETLARIRAGLRLES
jgi:hypothetical protein